MATDLKELIGKSILDVIMELPNFKLELNNGGKIIYPKISELCFVYYDKEKPREDVDLYHQIKVNGKISLSELDFSKKDKMVGFTSRVRLGKPYENYEYKYAHIPLIDFDCDGYFDLMSEKNLLSLIKNKVKEITELDQGVILKSGSKRNYHFIGTNRLLNEDDFITFLGLCLTMKYKGPGGKWINLADAKHIGHSLTPMKQMAEVENQNKEESERWSRYCFGGRFSTLRIKPKNSNDDLPKVIDVLN